MSETTTIAPANASTTMPARFISQTRSLLDQPAVRRALPAIGIGVIAVISLLAFLSMQGGERTTLYAGLSEADKGRVVDALKNIGVDVTLDPATGEVMVPVSDYHHARIALAGQGLPASVPDGYQGLSEMPMGSSRSIENMRLKQAQEAELARSISEVQGVAVARVHLALPEKSAFARKQPEPAASIFLQMKPGRVLGETQIEAIVHLVSSSIPMMSREKVTVIDQYGNLLSKSHDDMVGVLSHSQLQYRMKLETIYQQRIMSLLVPIVGNGNVRAQVNLDIDFTRSERTEEIVDPKKNALRSEQNNLEVTNQPSARGIPGAVSNTPPTEAEITAGVISEGTDTDTKTGLIQRRNSNEVRNYEVSRVISNTQNPTNLLKKISVSVLVRENEMIDEETGEVSIIEITEAQRDIITSLVRDAIGIDERRGDTITLQAAPFAPEVEAVSAEWHESEKLFDTIDNTILVILLAIVAFGIARPLINRIMVPAASGQVGQTTLLADEEINIDTVEVGEGETLEDIKAKLKPKKQSISAEMLDTANTYDDKVAVIRMIVSDEAGRVSNVFKAMMRADLDEVV